VRAIVVTFCRTGAAMTVRGREHVPADGPFVLAPGAPQHPRHPDLVGCHAPKRMRFMGADKYWKHRQFGRLLLGARRLPGDARLGRP
jgi:1-acyl-sn-glycerol-3-phosphate acyltransferase